MTEVLEGLVGRACLIYVDDVQVIGRSVEELVVNIRAVLLWFMERGLFFAAYKLVCFTAKVYIAVKIGNVLRFDYLSFGESDVIALVD